MNIQPKYKLLQEVAYRDRNDLNAGKIIGISWNETTKEFVYTLQTYNNEYPYYNEKYVFPLNSYIVANSETGLITIVESDEKNI